MVCFICVQQNEKLNLRAARKKEWVFISHRFSNWKKALVRFKEHQLSECHKLAMEFQISIPNSCGNIIQMSNNAAKKTMETDRFCLLKIIECLQYLVRQAMPMQGDTDEESNLTQLLKLRGKDQPVLFKWLERKEDKYTSHEIQNEIISIMANNVIRNLVPDIRGGFFILIADEYTDTSNKEQLIICIRCIDKHLEVSEDFLVFFFNIPDTGAETIVSVIKDVSLKLQLSLAYCRGQCYDGASNMLEHKTGVAKRIQEVQPNAHATHCHGHSLSLSVKDTVKNCKLLLNTMDTAKEVVTLIKFSPKRERLLGDIKENLDEQPATGGVISLCPTRWTVRASCFHRIIDNYSALLQEWIVCLDQKLQAGVRGRIIGCQAQMNTFDFFFGLHLGERLFSHTDNLSKTLQKTRMSAVSGQ